MTRDLPRYDVRGLLKFFCKGGWTACPTSKNFWRLASALSSDYSWHIDVDDTSGVLVCKDDALQIKFERCHGKDEPGVSIAGGDLATCVLLVPQECSRIVFVQHYKYRKELKPEPLRAVNACYMFTVSVMQASKHQAPAMRVAANAARQRARQSTSEYSFNTAFGVVEFFRVDGATRKANLKGFQTLAQAERMLAMAYSQLFTVSVPVLAVHLNLLILDAHCGIPLDIREGGQLEQSIAERFPDATIRFEEPEQNCHMLVSFASLACVAQARGSLAAFKVDVSITRLGKFIFRVSGASGSNAPFSREAEHDVIDGCRSLLAVLAPPPSRHRALEALDIDV